MFQDLDISSILVNHIHGSYSTFDVHFLDFCISVADPGVVQTNIMREVPTSLTSLAFFVLKRLRLLQSPERGINAIVDAALVPPVGIPMVILSYN